MVRFIDADWLEMQLAFPAFCLIDPRRSVKYLQGHIKHATNIPVLKAFDADSRLLSEDHLAQWLGDGGISREMPVVVYDDYDGQAGAMMGWILEYLGHADVWFLNVPFSRWQDDGREVFYRPVKLDPARFSPTPQLGLRASWGDLVNDPRVAVVDVRSPEEYAGKKPSDGRSGHIPRAKNIPWLSFVGKQELFLPQDQIRALLRESGVDPKQKAVVYCQIGMRAAVAHVALQQIGCQVSLYDGSFADWSRRPELPVEVEP